MLEDLIRDKKIPSPLVLEGENGAEWISKIAKTYLCEQKSACGQCRSCKQLAKAYHPDWLQANGGMKMEELREVLHQLRQRPNQSDIRFFSMLDFHDASPHLQNALLKTLEEPLSYWVMVLTVKSRFALLETIRSRCLIYKVPESKSRETLTAWEISLFENIQKKNEIAIAQQLDAVFKDRQKTKQILQKLVQHASQLAYPEHWQQLAPQLESCFREIDRNLNPRIVWDRAWARSFTSQPIDAEVGRL